MSCYKNRLVITVNMFPISLRKRLLDYKQICRKKYSDKIENEVNLVKLRQKVMYMLVGGLLVVLGQLASNIIDVTAQTTRYTTSRSSAVVYEYYPSTSVDTGFLLNKVTGTLQKVDDSGDLTTYGMTDGFLDGRKFIDKWNDIQQNED